LLDSRKIFCGFIGSVNNDWRFVIKLERWSEIVKTHYSMLLEIVRKPEVMNKIKIRAGEVLKKYLPPILKDPSQ